MMNIKMAGIEHERAPVCDRELFAFSAHACAEAMKQLREKYSVGCVLLSTCNRTELWVSFGEVSEEKPVSPFEMLCGLKQVPAEKFRDIVTEREEEEAVMHLFQLSCGMKSKIFGEDQIITQVKNALSLARENETVDIVLEKLFQSAITAAKKVKTEVRLSARDTSVVEVMLERLHETLYMDGDIDEKQEISYQKTQKQMLRGIRCLVIGNGEIGRLTVSRLLEEGADVTMTLRQYKDQSAVIPCGCKVVPYQERLEGLAGYDVIVSGTSSPHHTLKYEDVKPVLDDGRKRILFDLAVPRDISSRLSELSNLRLYNIDSLGTSEMDKAGEEEKRQAEEIFYKYLLEYKRWYYFRDLVPVVYGIGRTAAIEIYKRLERPVRKLDISDAEKAALEKTTKAAAERVISSMLYGLREHLDMELWEVCFNALETSMMDSIHKK